LFVRSFAAILWSHIISRLGVPDRMKSSFPMPGFYWRSSRCQSMEHVLVAEEPLSIRVDGKPYSVVLRTPGDEIAHAAGFCLAEGLIDRPDDAASIGFCDGNDTNVVTVTLTENRRRRIPAVLDRRGYISQTSCGLCGREMVADLSRELTAIEDHSLVDIASVSKLTEELGRLQPLRKKTSASHAAALFSEDLELLSIDEDVGRHNALDKAIGNVFLRGELAAAKVAVLSSRISYELVQKAARAKIPIIFAVSRPTALAVQLGSSLNMTLASLGRPEGVYIFCGQRRLIKS